MKTTTNIAVLTATLALSFTAFAQVDGVIHAGKVLVKPEQGALREQTLVLEDGKVAAIHDGYRSLNTLGLADVPVYDLKNHYVMPGMIDMHVHVTFERDKDANPHNWLTKEDADYALHSIPYLKRTLDAGFTSVRDLGSNYKVIFPLKRAVEAQTIVGPRIFAAGNAVTPTGGHADLHGYRHDVTQTVNYSLGVCDGANDCQRAVRDVIKHGADVIKITATGGVLSNTAAGVNQQLTDDELTAIVNAAHNLGRKVAAHAHGTGGINAALRAGVDSIEHGSYLDDESIKLFKEHDAYLVPTLLAGHTVSEEVLSNPNMPKAVADKVRQVAPKMEKAFRSALKNKVNIAFGTDSGVSRHGNNAYEARLMVKYGMTPKEVLVSATRTAAKLLGQEKYLGSLEVGKFADIIALEADPEKDIKALSKVAFVMKNGVVYKQQD
ncbi:MULTISPECIES: metal-dependent hydrolase family protein [Pseudoalteromonas]|uniref:Xaa-Pro dipeptidase n=1 Tax=Pseudoalteromonas amylolytica TaxID=1859457 RepID=A0A1S1MJ78_9GAMM|nr:MULTISPECIES: amidohydrolase family protein [Pseudoalteromonas]OHU84405.1 Xaa-Pro dipeptidase [Pseudoalteromonas sp. JW3]OHU87055.1 Xaa-Pro dipeptidase [Pseudoalteromonas amylolytica]